MCNQHHDEHEKYRRHRPSFRAVFTNLQTPMPLHRKIYLLVRNNLKKIFTASTCCGHPGEPGC